MKTLSSLLQINLESFTGNLNQISAIVFNKMEVDILKNHVNISLRKCKQFKQNYSHIHGTTGTIKRKLEVRDLQFDAKKVCMKQAAITLRPASFNYARSSSNSQAQTAIYRPLQIMPQPAQRKRDIENTNDDFEPHLQAKIAKIDSTNSSNKNLPILNDDEELSTKLNSIDLNESEYNAKKIEESLLFFLEKKKGDLRLSGGDVYFQSEDVEEFCQGLILDFEKWLQQQYQNTLRSKLKEQYKNYVQFRNDNLLTSNNLNLEDTTLEDNDQDYLC